MLVANLPACRPFLERIVAHVTGSVLRSSQGGTGAGTRKATDSTAMKRTYLELQERDSSAKASKHLGADLGDAPGMETRVTGRELEASDDGRESLPDDDDHSQKHIMGDRFDKGIRVHRRFDIEVDDKRGSQ